MKLDCFHNLVLALSAHCIGSVVADPASNQGPLSTSASTVKKTSRFTKLVAFGDELTDNGSGSTAHGLTTNGVYGFGTWTDGPVAATYLAKLLGVPLVDYAFGTSGGGGTGGATIDNSFDASATKFANGQPVPAVHDQIYSNYTAKGAPSDIKTSLQFLWIGLNDIKSKLTAYYDPEDAKNAEFASGFASRLVADAEHLIKLGAPYVFVPNIYPVHLAPVTWTYLCNPKDCNAWETFGQIIMQANNATEKALHKSPYASKIIYYDVFNYMIELMNNKNKYGLTQPLTAYCDGDPKVAQWNTCVAGSYRWQGASKFYWMNFIQPTTTVHRLIAKDMKATIDRVTAARAKSA